MDAVVKTSKKNDLGQGIIEYLLILVVTVAIILGVVFQFSQAFATFLQSYMGDYVECLLATGELPSLGSNDNNLICDAEFEPFSLANGRPLVDSKNSNSSQSSGSDSDGSDDDASSKKTAGTGARPNNNRISARGLGGGGGSGSGGGTSGSGKGESDEDDSYTGSTGQSSRKGGRFSSRDEKKRRRIRMFAGVDYADEQKKEKGEKKARVKAKDQDTQKAKKAVRLKFITPKEVTTEKEESWSFGYLIRFLIIGAIALAIIIFIGNQVLGVVKGGEK